LSDASAARRPRLRRCGTLGYTDAQRDMQAFVDTRGPDTPDELWLLQHPPVYTRGLSCSMRPLRENGIPVLPSDRGGQITYHGPGQLIAYPLLDLRRRRLGVRSLVHLLEQSVIDLLARHGHAGERRSGAPGVYVNDCKIAALGVRVRRGCSYHGLSLNVDMDLSPFADIDPCGYRGLEVTQMRDLGVADDVEAVGEQLSAALLTLLARD